MVVHSMLYIQSIPSYRSDYMNYSSYSASKCFIFEGFFQFYQKKHKKIVFNFFKINPNFCIASKLTSTCFRYQNKKNPGH